MSTVTTIYNISENSWDAFAEYITSNYCNLRFGFESGFETTVFDNLSFGYKLSTNGKVVQENKFPEDSNIIYRSCPDTFLLSEELDLEPSTSYQIDVWAENAGIKSEYQFSFDTPAPTDTGDYPNASVNHPDQQNWQKYKFDEINRKWVKK